ncbi:MAG: tetratricopeptide repeat protein [Anaerolineae bacterium]|nr:tetratricopeptide repeat protein [Anaerolineae bacterium]
MHHLTPHFVIGKLKEKIFQGNFSAVGLFVDISGFTTVTETLMQYDQYGVEELARVMRAIFFPLADSIYSHGGFICTCAGDAVTALFPVEGDGDTAQSYRHALAAAQAIQQQMVAAPSQVTPYGTFDFTAKIGLAEGLVEWGIVSGAKQQNAYYFKGSAIEGCVQAEHFALGNEIILSQRLYHRLETAVTVEPLNNNAHFVKMIAFLEPLPEAAPINLPPVTVEQASAFNPATLVQQTAPGEFRHALNVFINLQTVETHEQLAAIMHIVFQLQQQYGGYLNRVDFGDKGCHLLLFWGAPIAYETDIERSLNFLLNLQAAIATPMRAGVTYRISHAGFIGSNLREEYTCYGRGINLAARQMTHAPWQTIWLDEEMARLAGGDFITEFVGELDFKGFADPMAVYQLKGRRETANLSKYEDETHIIGREAELAELIAAIAPIFEGQFAGVLTIHGEAGIGKSRLVYELHRRLTEAEFDTNPPTSSPLTQKSEVSWFHCPANEILRQPLNPFRYWLRSYFQQSDGNIDPQNKTLFHKILDRLVENCSDQTLREELEQFSSYLGALVDLYWPDSPYEQSDPKLRFENTLRAIKNVIKAESLHCPVVIELEDAHWLDPQSKEMVTQLTRNIDQYSIAIVCATRYGDDGTKLTLPLDDDIPQHNLELTYFSQNDGKSFAEIILEGKISDRFGNFLAEKSHGNPFFIKQLVLDLKERGALAERRYRGQAYYYLNPLQAEDVPTTIRAVLVSRLDRLPQPVKHVVQVASVLGAEFDVQVLSKILPADHDLEQQLEKAEAEQIWVNLTKDRYQFRHALLRDSAYSMQVRSQLKTIHKQGAEALESLYAADLSRHYTALAYHYEQAELEEKSILYLEQAAEQARANYQNEEALDFYDRLLKYHISRTKEMVIYSKQGEILNLLGQWDLALEKLQQGLDKLNGFVNTQQEAQLNVVLGDVLLMKGAYHQALVYLQKAQKISETLDDKETLFTCFITMARNYMYDLEPDRALEFNQKALELAQEQGDEHGAAMAMAGIGAVHAMRDEPDLALPSLLQSIPIFKKLGDKREMIHPMFNAGLVYHFIGDYDQALHYFQQVFEEATEISDRVGVFLSLHFTGHLYHSAGQHEKAIACLLEALEKRAVTGGDGLLSQSEPYLASAYASLNKTMEALDIALQHFKNITQVGRDTESGRAHVVVGMILGQLQRCNNQPSLTIQDQMSDVETAQIQNLIDQITEQTKIAPQPEAFFTYAIHAATTESRPYLLTLVPALCAYGHYLYISGRQKEGLKKLSAAKRQALDAGMLGKIEQIKRICQEITIDFNAIL